MADQFGASGSASGGDQKGQGPSPEKKPDQQGSQPGNGIDRAEKERMRRRRRRHRSRMLNRLKSETQKPGMELGKKPQIAKVVREEKKIEQKLPAQDKQAIESPKPSKEFQQTEYIYQYSAAPSSDGSSSSLEPAPLPGSPGPSQPEPLVPMMEPTPAPPPLPSEEPPPVLSVAPEPAPELRPEPAPAGSGSGLEPGPKSLSSAPASEPLPPAMPGASFSRPSSSERPSVSPEPAQPDVSPQPSEPAPDLPEYDHLYNVPPHQDQESKPEEREQVVEGEVVEEKTPSPSPKKIEEEKPSHLEALHADENAEGEGGLAEKKSAIQGAASAFSASVKAFGAKLAKLFGSSMHSGIFKNLLLLTVFGGLLYLGYSFKIHQTVFSFVSGFFSSKPPQVQVEPLPDQSPLDTPITVALLFADNRGSSSDLVYPTVRNAYFFGHLQEPTIGGETGVTPAYYYGLLQDITSASNRFIAYVKDLRELRSLYRVDVYDMLNQTTKRSQALDEYIMKLKEYREKGEKNFKEIMTEVDDLKISYNSISDDRKRFEDDFFLSLQELAGEKSDFLLKSFVDVAQKQTGLKARLGGLEKLAQFYTTALERLDIRMKAVEKNRDALLQGIKVVDIPGANLDIIIPEGS